MPHGCSTSGSERQWTKYRPRQEEQMLQRAGSSAWCSVSTVWRSEHIEEHEASARTEKCAMSSEQGTREAWRCCCERGICALHSVQCSAVPAERRHGQLVTQGETFLGGDDAHVVPASTQGGNEGRDSGFTSCEAGVGRGKHMERSDIAPSNACWMRRGLQGEMVV